MSRGSSCTNRRHSGRWHAEFSRAAWSAHTDRPRAHRVFDRHGHDRLRAASSTCRSLDAFLNAAMLLGGMGPVNRAGDGCRQTVRGILRAVRRPGVHRHRGVAVHAAAASADASLSLGRQVAGSFAPSTPPATSRRCVRAARCRRSSKPTTPACTCSSFAAPARGRRCWCAEIIVGETAARPGCSLAHAGDRVDSSRSSWRRSVAQQLIARRTVTRVRLPGSVTFDPVRGSSPIALLASSIVVARRVHEQRGPHCAQRQHAHVASAKLWLIDHGARLYFHHGWVAMAPTSAAHSRRQGSRPVEVRERGDGRIDRDATFPAVKDHLCSKLRALDEADAAMTGAHHAGAHPRQRSTLVPDEWLASDEAFATPDARARGVRSAPVAAACRRRAHSSRRQSVHAQCSYDYAVIRSSRVVAVVPGAGLPRRPRVELDETRLRTLDAAGGHRRRAASSRELRASSARAARTPGRCGKLSKRERFDWLVAPRSDDAVRPTSAATFALTLVAIAADEC